MELGEGTNGLDRAEKKPGKQYLAPLLMRRGESFLAIYAGARGDGQAGLCASKEKDRQAGPTWLSQNRSALREMEGERERGREGREGESGKEGIALPRIKRGVLSA